MTRIHLEVVPGITMEDINRAAILAVGAARYGRQGHYMERFQAAWSAIAELAWTSPLPPTRSDMVEAGYNAINRRQQIEHHHHGTRQDGEEMGAYGRYWLGLHPRPASPETRVVEVVAMCQIWPRLTGTDRATIVALAACGTIAEAAERTGVDARTFTTRLRLARARFLALWHEGEEPSAVWRVDRPTPGRVGRVGTARDPGGGPRRLPDHGTEYRYNKFGCHCRVCVDGRTARQKAKRRERGVAPKRRVTVSQLAYIRELRDGGKQVNEIAAAWGVGARTLYALLRGAAQPAPDDYEGAVPWPS